MSLPGATEETEPTTIFEELNRNFIEPAVAQQVTENNANENDNNRIDNDQISDVGKCNQLTESQSVDVTDNVNLDNIEPIVHSDKVCDNNRNDGIEILNFNLQTIEDTKIDDDLGQAEVLSEAKTNISEENTNCDATVDSSEIKSDNLSLPSSDENTGKFLREVSPPPPPVPLVTYRWEDVRRDKQKVRSEEVKSRLNCIIFRIRLIFFFFFINLQGGYPWTYLDPHEPRVIVLNKDSKEDDQDKEPEELKTEESIVLTQVEFHCPVEEIDFEEKATCESAPSVTNEHKEKSFEVKKTRALPNFLKRALPNKKLDIQKANQSSSDQPLNSPTNTACCHPFVEKLKTMADKQLHKAKQYRTIRKHPLHDDEQIDLNEPQRILKLKESPKADRKEIASYVVKQDSDDVLEIIDLDESPSEVRKRQREEEHSTIVCPDEIIELPLRRDNETDDNKDADAESIEPTVADILESEFKSTPPPKSPRKHKEHVYEEIADPQLAESLENDPSVEEFISHLSLRKEGDKVVREAGDKTEDEGASALKPLSSIELETNDEPSSKLLAPISSIDSISEDERNLVPLPGSQEEIDETKETKEPELKSLLKREASPSSDKKVTFSMSTEENLDEPHREDVDLPEHVKITSKWSKMR